MKVDLLIKNGRVVDPSTGTNEIKNIAVVGKKLADIETAPEVEAKQKIDASGLLVVPGLVDAHCHLNYLGSAGGLPADAALLPMGVTAAADGGERSGQLLPDADPLPGGKVGRVHRPGERSLERRGGADDRERGRRDLHLQHAHPQRV